MTSFFSGLRSALTRATSYGSATSAQSPHEAPEGIEGKHEGGEDGLRTKTPTKEPFLDDASFINLEANQADIPEDARSSDESQAASSRTLSFDEETGLPKHDPQGPATPRQAGATDTPKTIFQTAQKDLFKTAFKSAAKKRDIFMTAKPIRTWNSALADGAEPSPTGQDSIDESSVTMSLDQISNTFEHTPSISSKRDFEEDEEIEDSFVHIKSATSPKRRRTSRSPQSKVERAVVVQRSNDEDEEVVNSARYISELDTSGLSDDETSGFSSSESWTLESPPPGLDRKGRKNWKRQQRRAISKSMEQINGNKKPRMGKRPSRSGFRRSVSGREVLIGHARRRFWEGKVAKDVYCY